MTCKECIHENLCVIKAYPDAFENTKWEKEPCDHFKPKSRFIELPCEVGQKVYYIGGGYLQHYYVEFIAISNIGIEIGLDTGKNEIIIYEEWIGKYDYFYTKEEAEKALEERNKK